MKIKKFNESNKSEPKFKKGDRCVYVYDVYGTLEVLDNKMVISSDPFWYDYSDHPNGGYWLYPIVGKGNECPEDFLRLYTGQKIGDEIENDNKF